MFIIVLLALLVVVALALFVGALIVNKDKGMFAIGGAAAAVVAILLWSSQSFTQVATGYGGVPAAFGKIDASRTVLTEGLNWVYPWENVYHMSHQQHSFHRHAAGQSAVIVQADDNIPMQADVSFHWILNYDAMALIRQQYGAQYWDTLMYPSAASAIRLAAGEFDSWEDLMTNQRLKFQQRTTQKFKEIVAEKMRVKGIPEKVISVAFSFPEVDLRKVLPVDPSLTEEIALTKAAVQKGKRKLTEIKNAALDARKRGQDGTAIRDTILRVIHAADADGVLPEGASIPESTSLADISQFILAIAEVKRADAVELSAEKGKLTVMVTGGGMTSLPLPGNQQKSPLLADSKQKQAAQK